MGNLWPSQATSSGPMRSRTSCNCACALGKNQEEFVAPCDGEIASWNGSLRAAAILKHEITSGVAVGVINRLEFVESRDHGVGWPLRQSEPPLPRAVARQTCGCTGPSARHHRQAAVSSSDLFFGKLSRRRCEHLLIDGVSVENNDQSNKPNR
jgi:hypothetical protein